MISIQRRYSLFASRALALASILGLCALGPHCQAINGGAAEVTWAQRTFSGASRTCESANISAVRLCWNAADTGSTGCRPGQFREFPCLEHTGVTTFEINSGPTSFFLQPVCADGKLAAKGTYQVPSEIIRTVHEGEVVSLDALLIVVTGKSDSCGPECTCVR